MLRLLRVYFWLYLILALIGLVTSLYILSQSPSQYPGVLWMLSGFLLFFPVSAILYDHKLKLEWLWKILIPLIVFLGVLGILGLISVSESVAFSSVGLQASSLWRLSFDLPIFVLALLYMFNFRFVEYRKPNRVRAGV